MTTLSDGTRVADLVSRQDRTVSTRVFTEAELFDLELEKIFDRVWVFVGHESEIPNKGDFVTRFIGRDPVLVTRDDSGGVRVILNLCSHRGTKLCRADRGSATSFECAYHGWIYKNTGQLLGVPGQKIVFGDNLDKSKLGLENARVETIHGLIFATWNVDGPSLDEYLGDFKFVYDLVFGHTEDGFEVAGPPQRWVMRANWKIGAENFGTDTLHIPVSHRFAKELEMMPTLDAQILRYSTIISNPEHAHACNSNATRVPEGLSEDEAIAAAARVKGVPEHVVPQVLRRLDTPQLRQAYLKQLPSVSTTFPNFSFINNNLPTKPEHMRGAPHHLLIRIYHPVSVGEVEIYSWSLVHKGASEDEKALAARTSLTTFGPAGTFEQDDAEVWSSITEGLRGVRGRMRKNYYLASDPVVDTGLPGVHRPGGTGDDTMLNFYLRWQQLLEAE